MNEYISEVKTFFTTPIGMWVYKIGLSILIFWICIVVSRITSKQIKSSNSKLIQLDPTLAPIAAKGVKYGIFLIGFIFILDLFGFNTNSLVALIGAGGIAIGLALKDTLSHIAAGIMLLILRPFKVGDAVDTGAVMGVIKKIDLFATEIEGFDGVYNFVPNSTLWGAPIKNFIRNGRRRVDIIVGIAYGDSIDKALGVLGLILKEEKRLLSDPMAQCYVTNMGESSIDITVRYWTTVENFWDVQCDLKKRIKEEFDKSNISIPFPQRDLHVYNH